MRHHAPAVDAGRGGGGPTERPAAPDPEVLRALVEHSADMILTVDADTRLLYGSPAVKRVLGYDPEDLVGIQLMGMVHPGDRGRIAAGFAAVLGRGEHSPQQLRVRHADGGWRWLEVVASHPLTEADAAAVVLNVRDITQRRRVEAALATSERAYQTVVDAAQEGVWQVDAQGRTTFANQRMGTILGRRPEDLIGRGIDEFTDDAGRAAWTEEFDRRAGGRAGRYDFHFLRPDGTDVFTSISAGPTYDDDGRFAGSIALVSDTTQRHATEVELLRRSLYDDLTGLPNRRLALSSLKAAIEEAGGDPGSVGAVLLDIDRFAVLNNSLGTESGDAVLRVLSERVVHASPPGAVVARTGGDEFLVIVRGAPADDLGHLAATLAEAVAEPVEVQGHRLVFTLGVGLARARPGDSPDSLLRDAESAMYAAQARGRPVVFEPWMRASSLTQLQTEADLRYALDNDELSVYFQPIVEIASGALRAAEALVRWARPGRDIVPPSQFIPLAEATGLIVPMGAFVLRRALQAAAGWPGARLGAAPRVSVNLSARQLADPGLVDTVAAALAESGMDPSRLCLEVTESVAMGDNLDAAGALSRLHALGVSLSIDDFGTGYSSLAYLKRLPVQTLKIDRAFISGVSQSTQDQAIVTAVVRLANALGLATVAEGVEDEEQFEFVRRLGCTYVQGYLFSPPMPAETFTRYVRASAGGALRDRRRSATRSPAPRPAGDAGVERAEGAGKAAFSKLIAGGLGCVGRAILDAADTMIIITDASGVIQYVNPAFTAVTGYRPDEAIGGTPRLLRSGVQDEPFYRRLWATVLGGEVWHGELVNRRKDGRVYPDEMTIVPVTGTESGERYFVAFKRDVSAGLRSFADALPVGIVHARPDGGLLYASDRAAGLLGHRFEELIGLQWLQGLTPGERAELRALVGAAYGQDPASAPIEGRLHLPGRAPLDLWLAPLVGQTGARLGVVILAAAAPLDLQHSDPQGGQGLGAADDVHGGDPPGGDL